MATKDGSAETEVVRPERVKFDGRGRTLNNKPNAICLYFSRGNSTVRLQWMCKVGSLVAAIHPIRDKCRNGRRGGKER